MIVAVCSVVSGRELALCWNRICSCNNITINSMKRLESGQDQFVLKISMATTSSPLFGVAIGLIGMGGANVSFSRQVVGILGRYV